MINSGVSFGIPRRDNCLLIRTKAQLDDISVIRPRYHADYEQHWNPFRGPKAHQTNATRGKVRCGPNMFILIFSHLKLNNYADRISTSRQERHNETLDENLRVLPRFLFFVCTEISTQFNLISFLLWWIRYRYFRISISLHAMDINTKWSH